MEDYIPYEEALELKALGFNKKCFGLWIKIEDKKPKVYNNRKLNSDTLCDTSCSAVTYSQAFKFFTEKYDLASYCLQTNKDGKSYYSIKKIETEDTIKGYSGSSDSYAEAELTCLRTLIKLIKK
jgi:hypothetical protein